MFRYLSYSLLVAFIYAVCAYFIMDTRTDALNMRVGILMFCIALTIMLARNPRAFYIRAFSSILALWAATTSTLGLGIVVGALKLINWNEIAGFLKEQGASPSSVHAIFAALAGLALLLHSRAQPQLRADAHVGDTKFSTDSPSTKFLEKTGVIMQKIQRLTLDWEVKTLLIFAVFTTLSATIFSTLLYLQHEAGLVEFSDDIVYLSIGFCSLFASAYIAACSPIKVSVLAPFFVAVTSFMLIGSVNTVAVTIVENIILDIGAEHFTLLKWLQGAVSGFIAISGSMLGWAIGRDAGFQRMINEGRSDINIVSELALRRLSLHTSFFFGLLLLALAIGIASELRVWPPD